LLLNKEIEFEIMISLLKEVAICEDKDENGSLFMREFTFFTDRNNHILNSFHFNLDDYADVIYETNKFSISLFDYADWFWHKYLRADKNNNPLNTGKYYCSNYTGPGWNLSREAAEGNIGTVKSKNIGPSLCIVEKVSNTLLKYTETYNGELVPINYGSGSIFWEFSYKVII
jgi:hypothetical protein